MVAHSCAWLRTVAMPHLKEDLKLDIEELLNFQKLTGLESVKQRDNCAQTYLNQLCFQMEEKSFADSSVA